MKMFSIKTYGVFINIITGKVRVVFPSFTAFERIACMKAIIDLFESKILFQNFPNFKILSRLFKNILSF